MAYFDQQEQFLDPVYVSTSRYTRHNIYHQLGHFWIKMTNNALLNAFVHKYA